MTLTRLTIFFFSSFVSSVQEIFSDSKAANIIKPSMSGAYHALTVFLIKSI